MVSNHIAKDQAGIEYEAKFERRINPKGIRRDRERGRAYDLDHRERHLLWDDTSSLTMDAPLLYRRAEEFSAFSPH